jgi:cysteine synthase B
MDGTDGAIQAARRLVAEEPERYAYLDQYSNPANWRAHARTTAEEIWRQTEGRVTHLVAGIGTSGTLVGTGRRLREHNPDVVIVAVQPDSPLHVMEGLKHLESCTVPAIYDRSVHQRTIAVSSEEAIDVAHDQARRGLLLGWSAGAAKLARTLTHGVIVAILPDGAERYLGDPMWRGGS